MLIAVKKKKKVKADILDNKIFQYQFFSFIKK